MIFHLVLSNKQLSFLCSEHRRILRHSICVPPRPSTYPSTHTRRYGENEGLGGTVGTSSIVSVDAARQLLCTAETLHLSFHPHNTFTCNHPSPHTGTLSAHLINCFEIFLSKFYRHPCGSLHYPSVNSQLLRFTNNSLSPPSLFLVCLPFSMSLCRMCICLPVFLVLLRALRGLCLGLYS